MQHENKYTDWKILLPEHQPDGKVWEKIENQLNFDLQLSAGIDNLELHKPDTDTWKNIEAKLTANKTKRLKPAYFSIAASIAVIMILSTVFFQKYDFKNTNFAAENNITLTEDEMEQAAMAEIHRHCSSHTLLCEQPDFKELMQLYEELNTEEQDLKNAMNQLGDSPEMIQALVKIENLKSETIRELILLIQA